jgi:hypothetical protein
MSAGNGARPCGTLRCCETGVGFQSARHSVGLQRSVCACAVVASEHGGDRGKEADHLFRSGNACAMRVNDHGFFSSSISF